MTTRDLIRRKILERGVSLAYVSKDILKRNHAYLQQYLERGSPARLPEDAREALARYLAIDERDLREPAAAEAADLLKEAQKRLPSAAPGFSTNFFQRGTKDRIPVLGIAETGPDGWAAWNGEVIETIARPPFLEGVQNAYAVYITGTSMEPRYRQGEMALIHPGKPVAAGSYVLVQRKPTEPGEGPSAVVKLLARRHSTKITLEQYNPAKTFDIKLDDIVSMHRVVGAIEG